MIRKSVRRRPRSQVVIDSFGVSPASRGSRGNCPETKGMKMGNHVAGDAMGKLAQAAFENRVPGKSALQILDEICEPYRGCDAEFEAEDPKRPGHVHPDFDEWRYPHPGAGLGMLMLEAFAPNGVADLERYAPGFDERDDEAAFDAWWNEVRDPFAARYNFC